MLFFFCLEPNCTIAWIRIDEFIVNGPDGRVSTWKVLHEENTDEKLVECRIFILI